MRALILLAGLVVLMSGPAASAQAAEYRILDGQMTYAGSGHVTCSYPDGSCRDFDGGWRLGSMSEERATDTVFAVHEPGPYGSGFSEFSARAELDISSWVHQYKMTEVSSQTACGTPTTRVIVDSDLQHDGGATPSVYEAAVLITPGAAPEQFAIRLAPLQGTEPRFGWAYPNGLRWNVSNRYSTVLETETSTGHPDCSGGGTIRRSMGERSPFDFYAFPYADRTIQDSPNVFDQPACDAFKCEIKVSGSTTWDYVSPFGGNTVDGSMTINWWFLIEARTAYPNEDCSDGVSNDFDGIADYPFDGGCTGPTDPSEYGTVDCDNGQDDDEDGFTDWPADNGCPDIFGDQEGLGQCEDGTSNDFDGLVDYPLDPGCSGPLDDELGQVACDNGLDDDRDGVTDWPGDDTCESVTGNSEAACSDGVSNDFDGIADYPIDLGCSDPDDGSELGAAACDNGIDDDRDGKTDWPGDPGCTSLAGTTEEGPECAPGYLAKEWLGSSGVDLFAAAPEADGSYGLAVKWCIERGKAPKIISADIRLEKDLGSEGFFGAASKVLQVVAFDLGHYWRPGKTRKVKIETDSGKAVRVTAETGHFEVCALPAGLGKVLRVSTKAFKLLPRPVRKKLVGTLIKRPAVTAVKGFLRLQERRERKRITEKLIKGNYAHPDQPPQTAVPRIYTKSEAEEAGRRLAKDHIARRERGLLALIDDLADELIDKAFDGVCVKTWAPKVTATIYPSGAAQMQESGYLNKYFWWVAENS